MHKRLGGAQPGELTPNDHRDIPDHMESCSVQKAGRRTRKEGKLSDGVCLPMSLFHVMESRFPGDG